jgi:DNA replication protein DnaC
MQVDTEQLPAMLTRLKLTAIRDQLDNLLDEAGRAYLTLRETLAFLCEREIACKDERRIKMSMRIAHFSEVCTLESFEFDARPSVDPNQIRDLAPCRWVAHGDALLFLGPPETDS